MFLEIMIILVFFIFIFYICYSLISMEKRENTKTKKEACISFQEGFDLTDLPIITVSYNKRKLNFILDTGANISYINEKSINNNVPKSVSKEKIPTITASGIIENTHTVHLEFSYRENTFSEDFAVLDMSQPFNEMLKETGVKIHGILGTSFFDKYKYVIDFSNYKAYINDFSSIKSTKNISR